MPWAFGPILTAGVTLGTAAVVVANPVVVPRADVQIPVADVSSAVIGDGHRGSATDMLDEDFIRAVGPDPAASTNPLAALTDLVRVLVADAADLGRDAILHAFATGAKVIADPALTSTSYPYVAGVPLAPYVPEALAPSGSVNPAALPWPTPTTSEPSDLGPVVAQALTEILTDVGDTGEMRVIAAAFAAGAALATEYLPIVGPAVGVVIETIPAVVAVLPRSVQVIGDGIRTVIAQLPLIPPISPFPALVPDATPGATVAEPAAAVESGAPATVTEDIGADDIGAGMGDSPATTNGGVEADTPAAVTEIDESAGSASPLGHRRGLAADEPLEVDDVQAPVAAEADQAEPGQAEPGQVEADSGQSDKPSRSVGQHRGNRAAR